MALNVNIIGRDSEGNLQALKVNSEGNLDLGQIKQGPAGTEPWPVQLSGTIATLDEPLPVLPLGSRTPRGEEVLNNITAFPQGELELQNRFTSTYPHEITSIGYDGVAYGIRGVDNDLFYTLDGANSIIRRGSSITNTSGWISGQTPKLVTRTHEGFVVLAENATAQNASVWFSETFDGEFQKVADLDRGRVSAIGRFIHNRGHNNSIILFGEYTLGGAPAPGQEPRLFASFDGGRTFEVILTLPRPKSDNFNNHFHAVLYDPYDSRIYASTGDGDNSVMYYSDNLGKDWKEAPCEFGGAHQQPTLMIAFPDKIAMGPDRQLPPSILSYYKDRKFLSLGDEEFRLEYDYGILSNTPVTTAGGAYSHAPYAQDGIEAYFTVPGTENYPGIVVGTGDGGNTWHKLYSFNMSRFEYATPRTHGIVGPDSQGYLYMFQQEKGTLYHLLSFKRMAWAYSGFVEKRHETPVLQMINISAQERPQNRVHGKNSETSANIGLVTPADYRYHRKKVVIIKNESNVDCLVRLYPVYEWKAGGARGDYVSAPSVPAGGMKIFSARVEGLEWLDDPFEGLLVETRFGSSGNGRIEVQFKGAN
jgi:hypothetical protein